MKVYLISDESSLYQWLVEGIYSTMEKALKHMKELLEKYEFDATNYYNIYEIELDTPIENEIIGFIE